MKEYLSKIQSTALVYAEILSKVLKTNVTIVDENFRRIASQSSLKGRYKEAIEKKDVSPESGIIAHSIEKRKVIIVDDPRQNEICQSCPERGRCVEKFHMSAPILVKGEARGALAFIANNNQQKKRMEKNKQLYLDMLIQFSNLIALKIEEEQDKQADILNYELLQEIVEHLDRGVLVFDDDGCLAQINEKGNKLLEIDEPLPIKVEFSPLVQDRESYVYLMKRKHRLYKLSGKLYHISLEKYSDIFIFTNGVRTTENLGQKKK